MSQPKKKWKQTDDVMKMTPREKRFLSLNYMIIELRWWCHFNITNKYI